MDAEARIWAIRLSMYLALSVGGSICAAAPASRVYLDAQNNVHVVSAAGKDAKLTARGNAVRPAIAKDGRTIAWLVHESKIEQGQEASALSELVVMRGGVRRTIRCEPFIRDFWFWKRGRFVAIDCGAAHFAGSEILYDAAKAKKLATVDTALIPPERRPLWSTSNNEFRDD